MKLTGSEKILVIKPSAFGDVLHALPLVSCINRNIRAYKYHG